MTIGENLPGVHAGLDIGGTATRFVIWKDGSCVSGRTVATSSFDDGTLDQRVGRLAESVRTLLPEGCTLRGVGIGASGPVDVERGVIRNPYTLAALSGFPIVKHLEMRLGCPVIIESDAVVAAIAEHRLGAGRQTARMLMVTLGTGIGVSFLIDGRPFRGIGNAHPEGGHIPIVSSPVRCYCGITGCWEQEASRTALEARLLPFMPSDTSVHHILTEAAKAAVSDNSVREVFKAYGRLVGRGLCALHSVYMPEVTVLGGSTARHIELYRVELELETERPGEFSLPTVVRVASLDEAGAIGAALLVSRHT